jgi:hypothetical protein
MNAVYEIFVGYDVGVSGDGPALVANSVPVALILSTSAPAARFAGGAGVAAP